MTNTLSACIKTTGLIKTHDNALASLFEEVVDSAAKVTTECFSCAVICSGTPVVMSNVAVLKVHESATNVVPYSPLDLVVVKGECDVGEVCTLNE